MAFNHEETTIEKALDISQDQLKLALNHAQEISTILEACDCDSRQIEKISLWLELNLLELNPLLFALTLNRLFDFTYKCGKSSMVISFLEERLKHAIQDTPKETAA